MAPLPLGEGRGEVGLLATNAPEPVSALPQSPNSGGSKHIHGSSPTSEPAFQPRPFLKDLKDVKDLLFLAQAEFSAAFKGSAVKRAKRRGLLRNAALALAGRDDAEAIAALEHALNDSEELVREAAEWALGQID